MQKRILISFLVLLTSSLHASNHDLELEKIEGLKQRLTQARELKNIQKDHESDVNFHQSLQDIAKDLKDIAPSFHQIIVDDLKKGNVLYGAQLTLLHKIVGLYVELDYQYVKLTQQRRNILLRAISGLDRYELAYNIYLPFYGQKKFRRLVNAEDRSYGVERKELMKIISDLIKKDQIRETQKRAEKFLDQTRTHPIFNILYDKSYWRSWRRKLIGLTLSDFGRRIGDEFVHHASGAFGNGAGSIRWRKGWMWEDEGMRKKIQSLLKPLDVITEKVGYTPTDFFIPGHFGHNAIYLGTEEQLKDLNLWDSEVIKPHQNEIRAGKTIIETDRSGTHFKSLRNFMNVDEFGLLRFRKEFINLEGEKQALLEIYKVAMAQLGKTYDFNFDVETTDQLVCSELLYQAFGQVNWPTEDYIGRTTISPDNVVSLALFDNPPLDLIYYAEGSKQGAIKVKNIDDLARDIGFVKVENLYKRPYKVCRSERVRNPGRGNDFINKRICEEYLEDLIYIPHRPVPQLAY